MNRRLFLSTSTGAVAFALFGASRGHAEPFEVTRSDAEWKAMLSDLQYKVMRQEGTERAGTSKLDKLYSKGTYQCRGCDLPVYSSEAKYDSGTGWPSFFNPCPMPSAPKKIANSFRFALNAIAAAVAATSATSSMTAPNRLANGIA